MASTPALGGTLTFAGGDGMAVTLGAIEDFELPPDKLRAACVSAEGSPRAAYDGKEELVAGAALAAEAAGAGAGFAGAGAAGAEGGGELEDDRATEERARAGDVDAAVGGVGAEPAGVGAAATTAGGGVDLWDVTQRLVEHPGSSSASARVHDTAW